MDSDQPPVPKSPFRRVAWFIKQRWGNISVLAALVLSTYNFLAHKANEHYLLISITSSSFTIENAIQGNAPSIVELPKQALLINAGETAEVLLGIRLVVAMPEEGRQEPFCMGHLKIEDPQVLSPNSVHAVLLDESLEKLRALTDFDEFFEEDRLHLEHASEMRLGLRVIYLNKGREEASVVLNLGTLGWDMKRKIVYSTAAQNYGKSISLFRIEETIPFKFLLRIIPSFLLADHSLTINCSKDSFRKRSPSKLPLG